MKNPRRKIKVSACLSLIKIKKMYLGVAIYCLQEELSRAEFNRELIYCLCDYVTTINKIISWFTILIDKSDGTMIEIEYAQAIVARVYVTSFKLLKQTLMHEYNTFVEIN